MRGQPGNFALTLTSSVIPMINGLLFDLLTIWNSSGSLTIKLRTKLILRTKQGGAGFGKLPAGLSTTHAR